MIAPQVKESQQVQCVSNLDGGRIGHCAVNDVHRIQTTSLQSALAVNILAKSKQSLIAECEKRAAQPGEDLQLIVRELLPNFVDSLRDQAALA